MALMTTTRTVTLFWMGKPSLTESRASARSNLYSNVTVPQASRLWPDVDLSRLSVVRPAAWKPRSADAVIVDDPLTELPAVRLQLPQDAHASGRA